MTPGDRDGAVRVAGPAGDALNALVDLLAARVAEKLAPHLTGEKPRYADGRNNPLGSKRAFLDAARRKDFSTFVRSRRITALWSDVERYVESRKRAPRAPKMDSDRAELVAAGVRLATAKGARR